MAPLIRRLGLALAIGLLVGLERGWRERDAAEGSRTAGIRTFGISGLLGGIVAALSEAQNGPLLFAAGLLGFSMSLTSLQAVRLLQQFLPAENFFTISSGG